jgi:tetratricopeptide (TPR) repeat protein
MLVAYGEGADTPAAIRRATGAPLEAPAGLVHRFLDERFARLLGPCSEGPETVERRRAGRADRARDLAAREPESYPVLVALGQALQEAGDRDGAMRAYERAAALVPMATGDDSPLALVAQLALEAGQRDRAVSALEQLMAHDHATSISRGGWPRCSTAATTVPARCGRTRASSSSTRSTPPRTRCSGVTRWCRVTPWRRRAGSASRSPRTPAMPVTAHCDLAEAYMQLGQLRDARRQTLAALELAPTYARAQDLLLAIVEGQP